MDNKRREGSLLVLMNQQDKMNLEDITQRDLCWIDRSLDSRSRQDKELLMRCQTGYKVCSMSQWGMELVLKSQSGNRSQADKTQRDLCLIERSPDSTSQQGIALHCLHSLDSRSLQHMELLMMNQQDSRSQLDNEWLDQDESYWLHCSRYQQDMESRCLNLLDSMCQQGMTLVMMSQVDSRSQLDNEELDRDASDLLHRSRYHQGMELRCLNLLDSRSQLDTE
jgi:hypothetical protein